MEMDSIDSVEFKDGLKDLGFNHINEANDVMQYFDHADGRGAARARCL